MKREDQQDATIRCLWLTSVSTCFGHHYARLQENKGPVTAFGVLFWFCWIVVGSGCGALHCRMRAWCPKHIETEVNNKHLIVASCWSSLFIFCKTFCTIHIQDGRYVKTRCLPYNGTTFCTWEPDYCWWWQKIDHCRQGWIWPWQGSHMSG